MAPTVYISDVSTPGEGPPPPQASHLQRYPQGGKPSTASMTTLHGVGVNNLRARRRAARVRRDRRTRGSIWLRSSLALLHDDSQQSMGREEEPHISTNSITSSVDSSDNNNSSRNKSPSPLDSSPSYVKSSSPLNKDFNYAECASPFLATEKSLNQRLLLLRRRNGLIDITIRTMKLMRWNQQLQHRLAILQAETRAFVRSVLSNPENQGLQLTTATMLLDKQHDGSSESEETREADMQDPAVSESGDSSAEK